MILKHYLLKLVFESDHYNFDNLDKALDVYSTFEKVLITGDRNAQEGEKCLDTILYQHELKFLNKEVTCYRNPDKPSCIDLLLTNSPRNFFITDTYFYRTIRLSQISPIRF